MQSATSSCPASVFRERYRLADFEINKIYNEGANWRVCAARCSWSGEPVVLQTYQEVGNVSGVMATAIHAAHSVQHPALLPLYAVFRDRDSWAAGGGGLQQQQPQHTIVLVYAGGQNQRPLDPGPPPPSPRRSGTSYCHTDGTPSSTTTPAVSPTPAAPGAGPGHGDAMAETPPLSERGAVRGLLQPLAEALAVLGNWNLRPPYVCGLDVWVDSPTAGSPGQAMIMVPMTCHRSQPLAAVSPQPPGQLAPLPSSTGGCESKDRDRNAQPHLHPAVAPYVAPLLRYDPCTATRWCEQPDMQDEQLVRKALSWSAAVLLHTALIGTPPRDKHSHRLHQHRRHMASTGNGTGFSNGAPSPPGGDAAPSFLPPLTSPPVGARRPTATQPDLAAPPPPSLPSPTGGLSGSSSPIGGTSGAGGGGLFPPVHAHGNGIGGMMLAAGGSGATSRRSGASGSSGGTTSSSGAASAMGAPPLWLSTEAADWFRRGLLVECASRPALEELLRHGWVARHAAARTILAAGGPQAAQRESLSSLPRELHQLLLDVAPLGVSRPGRQECEALITELQATEAPSAARPALPWQVLAGPQEEAAGEGGLGPGEEQGDGGRVVERYERAEQQAEDGSRVTEEVRVLGEAHPAGSGLTRAAKAVQMATRMAAMARARANEAAAAAGGGWQHAAVRGGYTFDDIARQAKAAQPQTVVPKRSGATAAAGSLGAVGGGATTAAPRQSGPAPATSGGNVGGTALAAIPKAAAGSSAAVGQGASARSSSGAGAGAGTGPRERPPAAAPGGAKPVTLGLGQKVGGRGQTVVLATAAAKEAGRRKTVK